MKKIEVYETANGIITRDKKEAHEIEKAYLRKKALEDLIEDLGYNHMDKDDIVDMILENFDRFKKVLNLIEG